MTERELDPYVEWIAGEARRPVRLDPAARARLMDAVRAAPRPARHAPVWRALLEPRSLSLSPMASMAAAAGLVGIGVLVGLFSSNYRGGLVAEGPMDPAVSTQHPVSPGRDSLQVVTFVFVAPNASEVSLVGDFNQWNAGATVMSKTPTGGTWRVQVPLREGRHVYAFVVKSTSGQQWMADPSAPLAPEDDFGTPSSVKLVGGSSS
jgi:hypothetical protein